MENKQYRCVAVVIDNTSSVIGLVCTKDYIVYKAIARESVLNGGYKRICNIYKEDNELKCTEVKSNNLLNLPKYSADTMPIGTTISQDNCSRILRVVGEPSVFLIARTVDTTGNSKGEFYIGINLYKLNICTYRLNELVCRYLEAGKDKISSIANATFVKSTVAKNKYNLRAYTADTIPFIENIKWKVSYTIGGTIVVPYCFINVTSLNKKVERIDKAKKYIQSAACKTGDINKETLKVQKFMESSDRYIIADFTYNSSFEISELYGLFAEHNAYAAALAMDRGCLNIQSCTTCEAIPTNIP